MAIETGIMSTWRIFECLWTWLEIVRPSRPGRRTLAIISMTQCAIVVRLALLITEYTSHRVGQQFKFDSMPARRNHVLMAIMREVD